MTIPFVYVGNDLGEALLVLARYRPSFRRFSKSTSNDETAVISSSFRVCQDETGFGSNCISTSTLANARLFDVADDIGVVFDLIKYLGTIYGAREIVRWSADTTLRHLVPVGGTTFGKSLGFMSAALVCTRLRRRQKKMFTVSGQKYLQLCNRSGDRYSKKIVRGQLLRLGYPLTWLSGLVWKDSVRGHPFTT